MLGSVMLLAMVGAVRAEPIPVDFAASVGGLGYHNFRGFSLGPAGMFADASLRASLTDEWSLTGLIWSYTQLDGQVQLGEVDYDVTVGYAPSAWPVSFTAGYIYYDRANFVGLNTQEAYFGVKADDVPWTPSLTAFYDFDTAIGTYLSLDAGNSWELQKDVTFDFAGHLGLDFGRNIDTFNDVSAGGKLAWQFLPEWKVFGGADVVVPSQQVATYGARIVPYAGVGYNHSW
jgi:hypothetical protein